MHETPSRLHTWRNVVPKLVDRFAMYAFDLLRFGSSERRDGLNVSVSAQASLLAELVEFWGLEALVVAGHDIGGGMVLRAHLLGGIEFSRISLIDAVVLRPWITPTTRHVKANLDVYGTMPTGSFEAFVVGHLRTTSYHPIDEQAFAVYMEQWRGEIGQKSYLQKDAQLDEGRTAEFEPLPRLMRTPVRILWGERDAWLNPSAARRLEDMPPNAELEFIPDAGHSCMEDAPERVADSLTSFFTRAKDIM
ncbi:MAG TPA: alpha/beta hydrolase [Rubrobacteraceae bacterium]|nr:alpha/beta hydrolase [Rubrobacteraceae bacterium]